MQIPLLTGLNRLLIRKNNKSGIAGRLLLYILLFSSLMTLLLVSVQLYSEYKNDVQAFQGRFEQIEDAFKASVTQNYWTLNEDLMQLQLKGIQQFANIDKVEVVSPTGELFMAQGTLLKTEAISHRIELVYSNASVKEHHLGTLILTGSLEGVHSRLFERVATIVFSQAVKTFFVAAFILWLVHYLVTRHVLGIADYICRISPDGTLPPLALERDNQNDELTLLVNNINETQHNVRQSYSQVLDREKLLQQAIKRQRSAEAKANYEKARALTTLSIIDDAIIVTDADSVISVANHQACKLFLTTESGLVGQSIDVIKPLLFQSAKPCDLEQLAGSPSGEYAKAQLSCPGAREVPVSIAIRSVFPEGSKGLENTVIIICDLTQEQMAKKMLYLSTHDFLTNLPNRYAFEQAVKNIPENLNNYQFMALGLFDLDNFKIINDTCGHSAGDALLSQLAATLSGSLPDYATLYRMGGDEFGLLAGFDRVADIRILAEQCQKQVADYRFIWEHNHYPITTSIGISILQQNSLDSHDPLVEADEACYRAKAEGGNKIVIQYAEDTVRHTDNIRSLYKLQQLLQQPNLKLFAQPIVPHHTASHLQPKLELLLRHTDDNGRVCTPSGMLETGERYGLITSIDHWVLEEAFRHAKKLIRNGWHININVSPQTLTNDRFIQLIESMVRDPQYTPGSICLEITERQIVTNISHTRTVMQALHKQGVTFAMDDFGTGFASYGFIRQLPIDTLKIDGELIQNIVDDESIRIMVDSIISMSRSMGILVAAEYVSSYEILRVLENYDVSYIQGEVVGLAEPVENFYRRTPAFMLGKLAG